MVKLIISRCPPGQLQMLPMSCQQGPPQRWMAQSLTQTVPTAQMLPLPPLSFAHWQAAKQARVQQAAQGRRAGPHATQLQKRTSAACSSADMGGCQAATGNRMLRLAHQHPASACANKFVLPPLPMCDISRLNVQIQGLATSGS